MLLGPISLTGAANAGIILCGSGELGQRFCAQAAFGDSEPARKASERVLNILEKEESTKLKRESEKN